MFPVRFAKTQSIVQPTPVAAVAAPPVRSRPAQSPEPDWGILREVDFSGTLTEGFAASNGRNSARFCRTALFELERALAYAG